jgi:hypothetical protein
MALKTYNLDGIPKNPFLRIRSLALNICTLVIMPDDMAHVRRDRYPAAMAVDGRRFAKSLKPLYIPPHFRMPLNFQDIKTTE